jgi:hypothetical protein
MLRQMAAAHHQLGQVSSRHTPNRILKVTIALGESCSLKAALTVPVIRVSVIVRSHALVNVSSAVKMQCCPSTFQLTALQGQQVQQSRGGSKQWRNQGKHCP